MNVWVLIGLRVVLAGLGVEVGASKIEGVDPEVLKHIAAGLTALALALGTTFARKS